MEKFTFRLSLDLRTKFPYNDFLYTAEKDGEDLYKVTWEENEEPYENFYAAETVENNIINQDWIIQ